MRDSVTVSVDAVVYSRIIDPVRKHQTLVVVVLLSSFFIQSDCLGN